MSQDIVSTTYHDQNVDSVREAVGQLNDKYPVLLMPVRLETRYMTVDRPTKVSEDDDLFILHCILKLEYLFEKMELIHLMELDEAEHITDQIVYEMEVINDEFASPQSLPYPEDTYWQRHVNSIVVSFQNGFQKNYKKTLKSTKTLKQAYSHIRSSLRSAYNQIKGLEISRAENTQYKEASQLIDRLNYLDDTFERLINKPINYTPETKHTYFNYVESTCDFICKEAESISNLINTHIVANTTQINRVMDFPNIYSTRLVYTEQKLNSIPSEYKRYEFLDKFQTDVKPITERLKETLTEIMVPKLLYVQKLKTVSAHKLTYQALIAQYELEKINSKGLDSYESVKRARVHIYDLLHKLRETGHDIIIGNQYQINQLRDIWSKVDDLLDDYTQIVKTVSHSNQYQQAGLTRAISHINENYREDLEGLKNTTPITEPYVQNTEFIESAKAYQMAYDGLEEIKHQLAVIAAKSYIPRDDLIDIHQLMEEFEGEFRVLTLKTTVLPEEYFRRLQNAFQYFQQYINQIAGKVSGQEEMQQPISAINQLSYDILAAVNGLSNDITDENDPFYDNFRKKFIFSKPTQTVNELWVRIYPDDVFIHSHEKAITEEEHQDTKDFWTEVWNVDNDSKMELAAWRVLAIKNGVNRAKYLRELLDPTPINEENQKPPRYILRLKSDLNMALLHLNGLLGVDLKEPVAGDEMESINETLVDCNYIQGHFSEEQRDLLNIIVGLIREVQTRLNDLSAQIDTYPNNERTLLSDFIFHFGNAINNINILGDHISQKTPVDNVNDLQSRVYPDFPPEEDLELKETTWSEAPKTSVLPNKFVFLGMQGSEFSHIVVGKQVPDVLPTGINPATVDPDAFTYDDIGNLDVDENIKWMTDFDASVDVGMGIIVPLSYETQKNSFTKIIVLGIKETGAEESSLMLEDLIKGHTYSPDGVNLIPIGTPTNITESKTSGYSSDENEDRAYELITGDALFSPVANGEDQPDIADGQRISDALGIDHKLFNRAEHADRKDIYKSLLMNKVMWPGTMGYYMEEIMDSIFNIDNIKRTSEYFTKYVSGRGFLPGIRISTQPYGILPITAFSRYKIKPNEELPPISNDDFTNSSSHALNAKLQERFDIRLKEFLKIMREQWMLIVEREELKFDDFKPEEKTAQEHFMELLGLQATSIEQYYRYNTNCAQRRRPSPSMGGSAASVNFSADDFFGPDRLTDLFANLVTEGNYIDDTFYSDIGANRMQASRIFRLRYHDKFGELLGPFVREGEEEFLKTVNGKTYIDNLLNTSPHHYWDKNYSVKSNSLFFIFLRQTLSSAYRDKALEILMSEGILNENTRRRAGTKGTYVLPTNTGAFKAFDKWDYLFDTPSFLEGMMLVSPFTRFPLAHLPTANSFWNYLKANNLIMSKYLYNTTKDQGRETVVNSQHDISNLLELRENIKKLEPIPISDLERMFAEHLDLCTYRLDAWQLGLANKRLLEIRKDEPEGIYLGACGWLENLSPGGDRTPSFEVPQQLQENDNITVYHDIDNEGFIHTPSLNHALTAAILRAGYIANEDSGDQSNPMAVNLTSQRVRMALKLLEGIRNGQDVEALLGYQFERGLHEGYTLQNLELDQYIYDLRREFPLHPDMEGDDVANPDVDRNVINVVHGTNLLNKVRERLGQSALMTNQSLYELQKQDKAEILDALGLDYLPDELANPIFKEVDKMANAFDALGDLLLSESVYHIAQGNHVRSAAVFDALSNGRVPPEAQIIHTPRSGHVLTQRVVLQLDPNETEIPAFLWQQIGMTPRAIAEPALNKWVGEILGDPTLIRCYVAAGEEGSEQFETVNLQDLNLQPLDVLFNLFSAAEEGNFELNAIIANYVRQKLDLTADVPLKIQLKEKNDHLLYNGEQLSNDIKTINEMMPLVSSLFDIVTKSRATAADDYVVPGQYVPDDQNMQQYDVAQLKSRVDFAKTQFESLFTNLRTVFQNKGINEKDPAEVGNTIYTANEINTFRTNLIECSKYGIPNSLPETSIETDDEAGRALAKKAATLIPELENRLTKAGRKLMFPDDSSDTQKVESLMEAAKTIFGKSFSILPLFKLRNFDEINDVLSASPEEGLLRNTDEYVMDTWWQSISKVRAKMNKLEMAATMTEMFDNQFPEFEPVQLPYEEIENDDGETMNDFWLGAEFPDNYEPENDKLSLVVLNSQLAITGDSENNRCGLLIDEWVEIIPNKEETTGITFNYDQPDSEPPQSMLLAVTPEKTGNWNWSDLVFTVVETMDLYKMRLVEPEQIDTSVFTQVLPAVMGEAPAPHDYRGQISDMGILDLSLNNNPIETEQE